MSHGPSVLQESRAFLPLAGFAKQAHVGTLKQYHALQADTEANPEAGWEKQVHPDLVVQERLKSPFEDQE